MVNFLKNILSSLKLLLGVLMVIWSCACIGQTKIYTENLFTQNQSLDRVKDFVLKDVIKKNDSLKKLYEKSHDNIYKKEINKNNIYINYLTSDYQFTSNYQENKYSLEFLESEIEILKHEKILLKKKVKDINDKTKDYNFKITDLITVKTETKDTNLETDSQIKDLKNKIFELDCEARLLEIDLMIVSRELTFLWNKLKRERNDEY